MPLKVDSMPVGSYSESVRADASTPSDFRLPHVRAALPFPHASLTRPMPFPNCNYREVVAYVLQHAQWQNAASREGRDALGGLPRRPSLPRQRERVGELIRVD